MILRVGTLHRKRYASRGRGDQGEEFICAAPSLFRDCGPSLGGLAELLLVLGIGCLEFVKRRCVDFDVDYALLKPLIKKYRKVLRKYYNN